MKQPRSTDSEIIDTVLSALGSAEPPTDLERRMQTFVERTLHEHAVIQPAPHSRVLAWLHPSALRLGAMAALILITAAILYRAGHPHAAKNLDPAAARTAMQPTKPVVSLPGRSATFTARSYPPARKQPHAAKFVTVGHTASPARQLVSYPAPPAPLTAEEKLLIRIAQAGNQEQLAMLDPVQRARDNARDDEEFEKFIHQKEMRKTQ